MKSLLRRKLLRPLTVAPLAGAWIEIMTGASRLQNSFVAPLAGAWIEILSNMVDLLLSSLPSRERGLKFLEMYLEMTEAQSLPSRERGLK